MMDKIHNKSIDTKNHSKTDKKPIIIGGLVVFLIAVSPFLFYLYEKLPAESQIWETAFGDFKTIFPSWYSFGWYFFGKAIPLYLLLLWFFTCKHWWHWIILVPIAMYAFQLWGVVNESNSLDELELYYILPLMMVVVPFVYLIRAKLFNKLRENDLKSIEEEFASKRTFWQELKDLFR